MNIKSLSHTFILPTMRDVFRVHLYTKLIENGIQPFENDIDMILELYLRGGYDGETQREFIEMCLEKRYKKSEQSLRNALSKYTTLGVLHKPKNRKLFVTEKYIPQIDCDLLVLQPKITHADRLQANLPRAVPTNGEAGVTI